MELSQVVGKMEAKSAILVCAALDLDNPIVEMNCRICRFLVLDNNPFFGFFFHNGEFHVHLFGGAAKIYCKKKCCVYNESLYFRLSELRQYKDHFDSMKTLIDLFQMTSIREVIENTEGSSLEILAHLGDQSRVLGECWSCNDRIDGDPYIEFYRFYGTFFRVNRIPKTTDIVSYCRPKCFQSYDQERYFLLSEIVFHMDLIWSLYKCLDVINQ